MTINFKNRLSMIDTEKRQNLDYDNDLDYEGVKEGRVALVWVKHYLEIFKNNLKSDDFREDIDFHVSETGGQSQPFFMLSNKVTLNQSLADKLDIM